MAINKVTTYDMEVINDWTIQVRRRDAYVENGVELHFTYHRGSIHPSDDWSSEPQSVQNLADALFTDAIKTSYAEDLAAKGQTGTQYGLPDS